MRKIIVSNVVSVDGYFTTQDGDITWQTVDEEFNKYAAEFAKTVDTILFGRVTYELFEGYWPGALTAPDTGEDDRAIAKVLSESTKIVFSKTKRDLPWANSKLLPDIDAAEVKALKNQDGKNIVIYGSGTIVQQLTDMGLIDEYQLFVSPVILGKGKPLFKDVKKLNVKLLETKTFKSGNVLLAYQRG